MALPPPLQPSATELAAQVGSLTHWHKTVYNHKMPKHFEGKSYRIQRRDSFEKVAAVCWSLCDGNFFMRKSASGQNETCRTYTYKHSQLTTVLRVITIVHFMKFFRVFFFSFLFLLFYLICLYFVLCFDFTLILGYFLFHLFSLVALPLLLSWDTGFPTKQQHKVDDCIHWYTGDKKNSARNQNPHTSSPKDDRIKTEREWISECERERRRHRRRRRIRMKWEKDSGVASRKIVWQQRHSKCHHMRNERAYKIRGASARECLQAANIACKHNQRIHRLAREHRGSSLSVRVHCTLFLSEMRACVCACDFSSFCEFNSLNAGFIGCFFNARLVSDTQGHRP